MSSSPPKPDSFIEISISRSALILSPCIYWTRPEARWYDDRFSDTTGREKGSAFHKKIDTWIKNRKQ